MSQPGYYQHPSISGNRIAFICDDSVWTCEAGGGMARKITSMSGECCFPRLSPDGKYIAFTSYDEGHPEVFLIPSEGGHARRLTYLGGATCWALSWTHDSKKIIISSDGRSPFFRHNELYELSLDGEMKPLNLGHANSYSRDEKGRCVLGRNSEDPAMWKRYRGGRAGEIWVGADAKAQFRPLTKLHGNMVSPMWIKGRVYFLSDHEGIGNIYSCKADGRELKRHTQHQEYYVRYPSSDGERIIYSSAGDLYILDCRNEKSVKLQIQAPPQETQSKRKFVDSNQYLEHYAVHPKGHMLGLIVRGQAFSMPLFDGPCVQHSPGSQVRYRLFEWLPDGEHFIAVDDSDAYERIARHSTTTPGKKTEFLSYEDIGRVVSISVSGHGKLLGIANHRNELLMLDVDRKKTFLIDTSPAERISHLSWSPDSRWLAYSYHSHSNISIIKVVDCTTYKTHELTSPLRMDYNPCFDPDGKYLYFLSNRAFKPVYDTMQFDLSFPQSTLPFVIPLTKDTPSPFAPDLKPFIKADPAAATEEKDESKSAKKSKKESNSGWVKIDFEGIKGRCLAFPFAEGSYTDLLAAKDRILFISHALKGIGRDFSWHGSADAGNLITYDFNEQKAATLQTGLYGMKLGTDNRTLIYRTHDKLRAIDALQAINKEPDGTDETSGRATGYIDLSRCSLLIDPSKEWAQMYREAWRLQQEQFWDEKMSDVDWDLVYDRYARVLPKIRTRAELSDLLWEMQGELGTSHAYEFGGDYPNPKPYYKGFLGADLSYDSKTNACKIQKIFRGDSWDIEADSPLAEPGLNICEGDLIVAVNGRAVSKELGVDELLIKAGASLVQLSIKRGNKTRSVTVRTLSSETHLRYRHWVETNRAKVEKAGKGKIGYIHIPDMGPFGFAEFHRSYLSEFHREALIVDVRYNRGGHVSSLLLEKLMRKRIGYDVSRWGQPQPYPSESTTGRLVAITNQFAGSDGDIFSHCFKIYELGPLVGKRTWGGVIGIYPRHALVDGSLTTQPEYSFWFQDVGWTVENYGTDPDYEVDFKPQDYNADRDPQLEKAISLALDTLKKNPVELPDFKSRPKLTIPTKIKE